MDLTPFRQAQWQVSPANAGYYRGTVYYGLNDRPNEFLEAPSPSSWDEEDVQRRLDMIARWCMSQVTPPAPAMLYGTPSKPTLQMDTLCIFVYGAAASEVALCLTTRVHDLGKAGPGPRLEWRPNDLPFHVRDAVRSLDSLAFEALLRHVGDLFSFSPVQVRQMLPPLAFVSYRREPKGYAAAERLVSFLRENGIWVWWDKDRIGWGDKMEWHESQGISLCDAAIVVFSPGYPEGPGCQRELHQVFDRLAQDVRFKAGAFVVGVEKTALPEPLKHRLYASVEDADDPNFQIQANAVLRGLFGVGSGT